MDLLLCVYLTEDAVFLEEKVEREECVMNSVGIHRAYDHVSERNWKFGQVPIHQPLLD